MHVIETHKSVARFKRLSAVVSWSTLLYNQFDEKKRINDSSAEVVNCVLEITLGVDFRTDKIASFRSINSSKQFRCQTSDKLFITLTIVRIDASIRLFHHSTLSASCRLSSRYIDDFDFHEPC